MPDETQRKIEEGRREAEALRPQRVINYAIKRAAGFQCQHEGCSADQGILVVRCTNGSHTTRCRRHLDRRSHTVTPGQWPDRVIELDA